MSLWRQMLAWYSPEGHAECPVCNSFHGGHRREVRLKWRNLCQDGLCDPGLGLFDRRWSYDGQLPSDSVQRQVSLAVRTQELQGILGFASPGGGRLSACSGLFTGGGAVPAASGTGRGGGSTGAVAPPVGPGAAPEGGRRRGRGSSWLGGAAAGGAAGATAGGPGTTSGGGPVRCGSGVTTGVGSGAGGADAAAAGPQPTTASASRPTAQIGSRRPRPA